ncbi:MAG: MotA/TolQ/ExbB proton channel family protein [Phycisphaerae bacterium]|nr:MotA/TolQ/ExbB proton channel family protein [Phycisphaerae bacterium]
MRARSFERFTMAVFVCLFLVGVASAEQPSAAPARADADIPYLYVFVVNSGPITWFIQIPLSVAVLALIIRYAILIRRKNILPTETLAQINQLFQEKKFREAMEFASTDVSMLGGVVHSGLHEAANGYAAMLKAVGDAAEEQSIKLLRRIEVLNIIGNISPMIGLFGTVTGMILAFWALVVIVQKGGVTDAAQLAAGIMYALGTTFWGLLVAIPALAAFSWFRARVEVLADEATAAAEELMAVFKPGAKK